MFRNCYKTYTLLYINISLLSRTFISLMWPRQRDPDAEFASHAKYLRTKYPQFYDLYEDPPPYDWDAFRKRREAFPPRDRPVVKSSPNKRVARPADLRRPPPRQRTRERLLGFTGTMGAAGGVADRPPATELPVTVEDGPDAVASAPGGGVPGTATVRSDTVMKYFTLDFFTTGTIYNGQLDQVANYVSGVPRAIGTMQANGERIGRQVRFVGYEYRFTFRNINTRFQNQATYSWAGVAARPQTSRTIPAVAIAKDAYVNVYKDTNGDPANNISNQEAFFDADVVVGGVIGSVLNAGTGVPFAGTNLDVGRGPFAAVELQPAQPNVINDQGDPGAPSWTSPAFSTAAGTDSGEMCTTRVVVFVDLNPQAPYDITTLPTALDLFASGFVDYPATSGLYRMDRTDRYLILEDTTWTPTGRSNHVQAVRPSKCIDVLSTYNDGTSAALRNCTSNAIFLLIVGSADYRIVPPDELDYAADGMFRVFYEESG